jgi:hypothetical protein
MSLLGDQVLGEPNGGPSYPSQPSYHGRSSYQRPQADDERLSVWHRSHPPE